MSLLLDLLDKITVVHIALVLNLCVRAIYERHCLFFLPFIQTHIEGCQYSKFQCGLCGELLANGEVIIHCQILYSDFKFKV